MFRICFPHCGKLFGVGSPSEHTFPEVTTVTRLQKVKAEDSKQKHMNKSGYDYAIRIRLHSAHAATGTSFQTFQSLT